MDRCLTTGHDLVAHSPQIISALWHHSHIGICYLQQRQDEFFIVDTNPAMVRLLAVPIEQLINQSVQSVFSSSSLQPPYYRQALETGESVTFESAVNVLDDLYWWSFEAIPATSNGQTQQLVVTVTDISGYKQTELKLAQTAQTLQQIIDNIPFTVLWKDCNSVYLGFNRHFIQSTGFDNPDDLIGKTDYDMPWQAEETAWYLECDRTVMGTDTPQLNIIEPQHQADGRQVWLSTSKIPLHDHHGDVSGILLVIEDITERKTTEVALRQSEERFRSLFEETSVIGMQIYDCNRRVIGWNHASEDLYGYTCEEAMGRTLEELIIPEAMRGWVIQAVEDWAQRGIPIPAGELTLCDKNGDPVEVFSSHVMLTNADGNPELYCLDLDIRDRKQAERILQQAQLKITHGEKMSSLGKMVAGIAHEINNPISFIDGNLTHAQDYLHDLLHLASLYQNTYPNPSTEIQTALQAIDLEFIQADFAKLTTSMQAGADRIRSIVDSLRNFSRLDETGAKAVDIHAGLHSTLTILNHRLKTTTPAIIVRQDYAPLPPVVCYPGPLNQVFMNILTNAIDALVEHHVSQASFVPCIKISTAQLDNNQVVITITDNGPGIATDIKSKIFDPFFTTKAVGQGTGMGLAISYHIITEQHQGQLLVDSTPGARTCFEIRLPITRSLGNVL